MTFEFPVHRESVREWMLQASCLLDLCYSIGLWPPFSALRASSQPAASIHSPALQRSTALHRTTLQRCCWL